MKIKYNIDAKVEYKTSKLYSYYSTDNKHREVYFRIVPSDLGFFKRVFCNPWRQVYKAYHYCRGLDTLYTPKEYNTLVKQVKTFGNMCDYLEEQNKLIHERYIEFKQEHMNAVERGEEWED